MEFLALPDLNPVEVCAVRDGGSLWCWGDNTEGQAGIGAGDRALEPVRICF